MTDNGCFANVCNCEFWENDYCWAYGKPVSEVKECSERKETNER